MQNYELLFILPGTLAENETQPTVEKVKMIVERNGGENIEIVPMDKKRLAYPMQQIRYGYFFLVFFKAGSAGVKQMQADLKIMPELLRAVIQKFDSELGSRKIEFGQLMPTTNDVGAVAMGIPVGAVMAEQIRVEPVKDETQVVAAEEVPASVSQLADSGEAKPAFAQGSGEVKPAEVKPTPAKREEKKKLNLDEIDKKLDEILDIDLGNV